MLSVLPLWILLNVYAFLLDVLSIASGLGAWLFLSSGHSVWGALAAVVAALFFGAAVRVHLSYPAKINTYNILYKRNSKTLHRASFHEFMDSPCYRMVVRTVLHRTGHPQEYSIIYKEVWGEPWRFCSSVPADAIIFNSAEEGERWLRSQQKGSSPDPEEEREAENQLQ